LLFKTRAGKIIANGKLVKPTLGWLMILFLASEVVMILNLRIKKKYIFELL